MEWAPIAEDPARSIKTWATNSGAVIVWKEPRGGVRNEDRLEGWLSTAGFVIYNCQNSSNCLLNICAFYCIHHASKQKQEIA